MVFRWGEHWEEVAVWDAESVAVRAPSGARIVDVTIAEYFYDSSCAFVIDLLEDGEGETRPHYVQPKDVTVADETLQPLPWIVAGPPRNIRVFHRARYYWMVTYLARGDDEDRPDDDGDCLFWGAIDWAEPQPTLRPLSTPAEFDDASCVVGLV